MFCWYTLENKKHTIVLYWTLIRDARNTLLCDNESHKSVIWFSYRNSTSIHQYRVLDLITILFCSTISQDYTAHCVETHWDHFYIRQHEDWDCCGAENSLQLAMAEKWSKTEFYNDIDEEAAFSMEQSRLANIPDLLNKVLAPTMNFLFLKCQAGQCTITYHLLFSYFDWNIRNVIIILRSFWARLFILAMGPL